MSQERTFPDGGLVNHNVHSLMSGCLTLKLSLSWKTVTSPEVSVEVPFPPSGEIGIVDRSTCADSTAAAMIAFCDNDDVQVVAERSECVSEFVMKVIYFNR